MTDEQKEEPGKEEYPTAEELPATVALWQTQDPYEYPGNAGYPVQRLWPSIRRIH